MTTAPVWPGPRILVPMACDLLLFGTPDNRSAGYWAATQTNYQSLYMGGDPEPLPFNSVPRPAVGAHLMWTLPYRLRHGIQDTSTGSVDFPIAPNRWLIMRLAYPANGGPPSLTASIVNSDTLSSLSANTSQYPSSTGGPASSIGQFQPLETWTAPSGPVPEFLQAIGPGIVSWAAAYDNVKNVFSLYDELPSEVGTYAYMLTGWYANPESDPSYDLPTDNNDDWQTALSHYDWSIGDGPDAVTQAVDDWNIFASAWGVTTGVPSNSLPEQLHDAATAWIAWRAANGVSATQADLAKQTLCHSLVATVDWKGANIAYGTGAPGGGTDYPSVAVGNTSAEAISAFMAKTIVDKYQQPPSNIPIIEQAMIAFQLGILNQLTNDVVGTETLIQQAQFGGLSGGAEWIIAQSADTTPDGDSGDTQVVLISETQTEALTLLIETQEQYDTLTAVYESQRGELSAVIYKANQLQRSTPDWLTPEISNTLKVITSAVEASAASLASLLTDIGNQQTALAADLGSDYDLKQVSRQVYYQPNDPVILVGGASIDTKWAAPGTYSGEDTLRVRVTGQSVTGLEITSIIADNPITETLTNQDIYGTGELVLPAKDNKALQGLPKEIGSLLVEAIFLDPSAAPFLATLWFAKVNHSPSNQETSKLIAQIITMQRNLWSQPQGMDETIAQVTTGFKGMVPPAAGVSLRSGQPWTPIYVDWQVRWMPNATSTSPLSEQLNHWKLREIDYEFDGALQPELEPISFVGRSVINADGALSMQEQFSTFEDDPDYDNLPAYIRNDLQLVADTIGNIDMVTQSLSGLREQMTTRFGKMLQPYIDSSAKVPVTQAQIKQVGSGPWTFQPNTGIAPDTQPPKDSTIDDLPDFSLRAGHFDIMKLWVVDSFGQILVGQNPQFEPDPIQAIVAQSMITKGKDNTHVAQLAPRIVQPTRADLRLLNASDDTIVSNSSVLTSPICGWIMTNHLDDSLMVFNTTGSNQGALISIEGDNSSTGLRWDQAVGSSAPLGSPPTLANKHLQGFVNTLLQRGMLDDTSYAELLDIIDAALWRISSTGDTSINSNLSLLLGRPLALVRARIDFDLRGMPLYNQSWAATGRYYVDDSSGTAVYKPITTPISGVNLNFRIGDLGYQTNGVVGYFVGDDYSTIYSAHDYIPTSTIRKALKLHPQNRTEQMMQLDPTLTPISNYVGTNHLIELAPDLAPVYVTILMDPTQEIPFISGSLPSETIGLPTGQYSAAMEQLQASFRVGPILTDPASIQMPLPAEVRGKWGWAARVDVTNWTISDSVGQQDASAALSNLPPTLSEGWLTLSDTFSKQST
ncbi:hypothetical protein MNBD_GAMMA12-225 [hydrothermal vent metagenome]|uniref:Uncharacterized protein n=1 Tax=hydrothermal vent metagenome TaxID=652676 RepID=A0A3B0YFW4_9ZZZZ